MLPGWLSASPQVRHHVRIERQPGTTASWPAWLPGPAQAALEDAGFSAPWSHQSAAAEAAHAGQPTMLATGTASGKTLGYLLPVLAATWGGPVTSPPPIPEGGRRTPVPLLRRPHTALYLAPTKALAHDQTRAYAGVRLPTWRVAAVDGDSDRAEREWARDHAAVILTNPDFLHASILPGHQQWQGFLKSLRYVVIDESHVFRGVFGAHVALVLRRLRRLCERLGAEPVFIGASATSRNPAQLLSGLTGLDRDRVCVVDDNTAPRGAVDVLLWESTDADQATGEILQRLVAEDVQTLAFVRSRRAAEVMARRASGPTHRQRVLAYRGGYLPTERRAIERGLAQRSLLGVASTNALELGVDICGLDAVVVSGHPGRSSMLWQRIGRAGRRGDDAVAVVVAGSNPLDGWMLANPSDVLGGGERPIAGEAVVIDAGNPTVVCGHLAAAAQEAPLTPADERWFGPATVALAEQLAAAGVLRRRPTGWFWTRPERAALSVDLRGIHGEPTQVLEASTGRVVGTVDPARSDETLHQGAIYLHADETWVVTSYDREDGIAEVEPTRATHLTQARIDRTLEVRSQVRMRTSGPGTLNYGEVAVGRQVTGYLERDLRTGTVRGSAPVDLPRRVLPTCAVWWEIPGELIDSLGWSPKRSDGAVHALEHALSALLGAVVGCDRDDVAGHSPRLPDGGYRLVVHDTVRGGAGFAAAGFENADTWLQLVTERLATCECATGCPRCVITDCPERSRPLDRPGALVLARTLRGEDAAAATMAPAVGASATAHSVTPAVAAPGISVGRPRSGALTGTRTSTVTAYS